VKRVGFVVKHGSGAAEDIARELSPRLRAEGIEVLEDESTFDANLDLLVVLGGDGTFLRASALGTPNRIPVLGVNLGSLGFLTAFSREDAERATLAALRGELPIEERMLLEVTLHRANGEKESHQALNDCVVSQGAIARLLDLDVTLDGTRVTVYKADGLIIATPTGSTAYNLAAGGPILVPDLKAIVLTPICPHTLTNRPLVAPGDAHVQVTVGPGSQNVVMTIDGQVGRPVAPGDRIEVRCAPEPMRMVISPVRGFFDVLRQKLNWGERTAK
jgi:NAD+ kinase